MPIDLSPFLPHLPVWTLVLFRLTGLFLLAPLVGGASIPGRVKIFLALGLSFCVYPVLMAPGSVAAAGVQRILEAGMPLAAVPMAVAMELAIGLALGFGAMLPLTGMQVAGQVADQQMGFGLGAVFNPDLGDENGPTGQFYYLLAMAVYVILGGHRVLLSILVGSFQRIPLGGFVPDAELVRMLLGLLASSFELALRVSAPLLCLVFLETVAMGFLARTVPQLNILSIGFSLRIMACTAVIVGSLGILVSVYGEYLSRTFHHLEVFFLKR